MFLKKWTSRSVIGGMMAAICFLALGQTMGLRQNRETQTSAQAAEEPETLLVSGTVIRQEQVIYADGPARWKQVMENGQRAAAGAVLFLEKREESLEQRALWLQTEADRQLSDYEKSGLLHQYIRQRQNGQENGMLLRALLLSRKEAVPEQREAPDAEEQEPVITAPVSGIFFAGTDGLESLLTPQATELPTVSLPVRESSALALGRLITGDTWYYSAVLPKRLEAGETVMAQLLGGGFGTYRLTVEKAEPAPNGFETLFSAKDGLEAVAGVRQLTMKILSD